VGPARRMAAGAARASARGGTPDATGPALSAATDGSPLEVAAPAKLTLSLRIAGVRPDGLHLLEAEMVSLDLADTLLVREGDRLTVLDGSLDGEGGSGQRDGRAVGRVPLGRDNLVVRALHAVGRRADIELVKRVPAGAGLGGGSADAAAVLRWAGCRDPEVAIGLGSDVPFCLSGGRAMVRGVGGEVESLPYEARSFTLLLLPFGMDTAAVYRAFDRMAVPSDPTTAPAAGPWARAANQLEPAALAVDGRLAEWKAVFAKACGTEPRLAGSGSTWFVEGTPDELGSADPELRLGHERARLVGVRTVPALV
jgi:4-diphosphocytidyl-2-C-methyl-D-erythritol kinase